MRIRPGSRPEVNSSVRRDAGGKSAVFLIGFMGAGKTSVGQALSRRLGWLFEDLDERITASAGRTIEQIFREVGEPGFRSMESAALQEVVSELGASPRIVALGGGAYAQAENARLLKRAGVPIVFLDAPVEELWRRCAQQDLERPLRRDEQQFRRLYQERRRHYRKAPWRIETSGKDIESIAVEVALKLGFIPRANHKE